MTPRYVKPVHVYRSIDYVNRQTQSKQTSQAAKIFVLRHEARGHPHRHVEQHLRERLGQGIGLERGHAAAAQRLAQQEVETVDSGQAPKLPVMPTTPPVAIGAISRPSSDSASLWSCLAAIFTTTSRVSPARLC